MNDGSVKMAEEWPVDIKKHICLVQELEWPEK